MQPGSHETDTTTGALARNAEAATSKVTPAAITCAGKAQMCSTAAAVRREEVCAELWLLLQNLRKPKPWVRQRRLGSLQHRALNPLHWSHERKQLLRDEKNRGVKMFRCWSQASSSASSLL